MGPSVRDLCFSHLINSGIHWNVKIIFLGNIRCHKSENGQNQCIQTRTFSIPSTKEMSTFEEFYKRLGCRQANKCCWLKGLTRSRMRRSILNIPRRRSIDRGDWYRCFLQLLDDGAERLSNFAREAEALKPSAFEYLRSHFTSYQRWHRQCGSFASWRQENPR